MKQECGTVEPAYLMAIPIRQAAVRHAGHHACCICSCAGLRLVELVSFMVKQTLYLSQLGKTDDKDCKYPNHCGFSISLAGPVTAPQLISSGG